MNALPSPKPNRRKRLAIRFAALVVAASALGAAYWFTRPPELVWWTSPSIGKTGLHARVLIPSGWELIGPAMHSDGHKLDDLYIIMRGDKRPSLLRRLLPTSSEGVAGMTVHIQEYILGTNPPGGTLLVGVDGVRRKWHHAIRVVADPHSSVFASVEYSRTNLPAFNRTYRQICNSLRIE
jgi:hypothetical protein